MKNLFIALFAMISFAAAAQSSGLDLVSGNGAKMEFVKETIDYGTIEHNADGVRFFEFKNTGSEPLIISNCKGSCGCTVPICPKEPILPGEKGKIQVKYATDRVGAFTKNITVTSNGVNPNIVLTIKGTVKPDPEVAPAK